MKQLSTVDYQKIEIEELKAKLLIFQRKANDISLDTNVRTSFALKANKTLLKLSQLKAQIGHTEQPSMDLATPRRKSDGHV